MFVTRKGVRAAKKEIVEQEINQEITKYTNVQLIVVHLYIIVSWSVRPHLLLRGLPQLY